MTDSVDAPVRCATCGATHKYDCPCIGPVQFLQAIMHDATIPIVTRMGAADRLIRLSDKGIHSDAQEPPEPEPVVTYQMPEQRWVQ